MAVGLLTAVLLLALLFHGSGRRPRTTLAGWVVVEALTIASGGDRLTVALFGVFVGLYLGTVVMEGRRRRLERLISLLAARASSRSTASAGAHSTSPLRACALR